MRTVHVYAGPTLSATEIRELRPAACVHPPVAHGDLLAAALQPGDAVVIVDGLYHQCAPVRHKEILELVDRGVHVVGCSSMGALRAAELVGCGMIGHGEVFALYRDGVIDADDEVAVVHGRAGDLATRNVPLVAVRWLAAAAREAGVVSADQADRLVALARGLHYTDRSWRMVELVARREDAGLAEVVDAVLAYAEAHPEHASIKHRDAVDTLRDLERLVADPPAVTSPGSWRNPHAFAWSTEHARSGADEAADGELLRHAQLYDADFPARYRAFVLAQLGAGVDRWAAQLRGLREPGNHLLTAAERDALDERELALRSLVRAYSSPRLAHDLCAHCPDLVRADAPARERIAEAKRINTETWWRGREPLVARLPERVLLRHLARLWDAAPDRAGLDAAARDRGFGALADAVRAVRPHFLRDDAAAGGTAVSRWRSA